MTAPETDARCPICGIGTLTDLAFDAEPGSAEPVQTADSHELSVYSCGHRVTGPSLATADPDRLDVERRQTADTVDPGAADPS